MIHEKPICVIDICKGYCCENLSKEVSDELIKLGLKFELNEDGTYRCLSHNKESGICYQYNTRPLYCIWFFCPSAKRGFMRQAKESIEKEEGYD